MTKRYELPCNIAQTLNLIGDKWSMLVIHSLMLGHCTYKELQEDLVGIPSNLLASRLKELEENELVISTIYQNHPPRLKYELTQKGEELKDVFYALIVWGEKYLGENCYKQLVHDECESPLTIQYYCPKCNKIVSEEEKKVIPKQK